MFLQYLILQTYTLGPELGFEFVGRRQKLVAAFRRLSVSVGRVLRQRTACSKLELYDIAEKAFQEAVRAFHAWSPDFLGSELTRL